MKLVNAIVSFCRRQRGVSMIEFSLGLPLFLLLSLFILDLGRYLIIYSFLNYAALRTANAASNIEIETNIALKSSGDSLATCDNDSSPACLGYVEKLLYLAQVAESIAFTVVAPSTSDSSTKLTRFRHYDFADFSGKPYESGVISGGAGGNLEFDVAIIRPGERVVRIGDEARLGAGGGEASEHAEHTSWPFETSSTPEKGWPKRPTNWAERLNQEPIEVRMEATFAPVTPFFRPMYIQVLQLGYRRAVFFSPGPLATMPAPAVPPTIAAPPPYQTLVPPTPGPGSTATATATIASTPTVGTPVPTSTAAPTRTPNPECGGWCQQVADCIAERVTNPTLNCCTATEYSGGVQNCCGSTACDLTVGQQSNCRSYKNCRPAG